MLSLVMLSLGASFAADDNVRDTLAIADEITTDDSLAAVEEDVVSDVETSSIIINNTNLHDYVDSAGGINENITADELIFDGNFENLNLSVDRPFIITGSNSTLTNPNILLISSNVTFKGFTIIQTKGINSVFVGGLEESPISDVTISGLTIDYADDMNGIEAIAVRVANTNNFKLLDSVISYVGNTTSYYVNNAVLVSNSSSPVIKGNKFKLSLVSSAVGWAEVPAGSGNWVSSPMSEGIVVDSSSEVMFEDNIVNITYNGVSGDYDTIYGIDFKDSAYTAISGNTIFVSGHSYVYGIIISGFNFVIDNNTINVESDNYYANGIDVEGPAFGEVKNNEISVNGVQSAYGIYSGMNGQNVSAIYTNNTLSGKAYNVFGMSLGDVESQIDSSNIALDGNYTTGIAYYGNSINITNSRIILNSSEVGNESIWESFGVEAVGIKVIKGEAKILNNVIATAGKGVSFTGNETDVSLENNFINVVGNVDKDAYAVYAVGIPGFRAINNTVDYEGMTQGTGVNYGVYLNNVTSPLVADNKFDLNLVSSYVPWFEIPTSSGNWVSSPVSEGIVIEESVDPIFMDNVVNVTYGDVVGLYDTIYAVDFKNSYSAKITSNNIAANGHTYIYGIIISGDDFFISSNNITSASDIYYANGIDIEGPANGLVENNNIDVKAPVSAYVIYSGMNGQNVSAKYVGNNISGNAYNVFGMSLGDVVNDIAGNYIALDGNYTTGIAYRGTSINVNNTKLVLNSSEVGNESVWEAFGVESVGIKVVNGTATITDSTIATAGKGISLTGVETEANLENNFINVVGNVDKDAYAVYAVGIPGFRAFNNTVDYQGMTQGTGVNYGVYLNNVTSPLVADNKFDLNLVSSYVPWAEVPAGSGNWVSSPVSEGIVIEESVDPIFMDNVVNVTYGDVVGLYDTIYAVDFKNSNSAKITSNNIAANGHTYIYGIIISGDDFFISSNNITSASDIYYANGIDIEGPANGLVENNNINVKGVVSAYPIYSGMNGQNVSVIYSGNAIGGNAYLVYGMSLGDVESYIENNSIGVAGNYTNGIGFRGGKITIVDNVIFSMASNVGDMSVWESLGVDTVGIKIAAGNSTIINNNVTTTGNYPVSVKNTSALVHDNFLLGFKFFGDEGVENAESATVYNNTPVNGNKTATVISISEVDGNCNIKGILKDESGEPVILDEVHYTFNNVTKVVKTDLNGTFEITGLSNGKVDIFFEEDSYHLTSDVSITLKDIAPVREPTVANVTIGDIAIGKDTNVTVDIPGATGNVSVIFDGVETIAPLNENGSAVVTIENLTGGEHSVVVIYTGDETHDATYAVKTFILEEFPSQFTNITVDGTGFITAVLIDGLGGPIANATVTYKVNGAETNVTTDEDGSFLLNITNEYSLVEFSYAGNDYILPSNVTINLQGVAPVRDSTVIVGNNFTQYAIEYNSGERGQNFTVQLVDAMGNPLANKTVLIGYNGKTLERTTNATGHVSVQINLKGANRLTFAVTFLGDKYYNATMSVYLVTIIKKPVTITASAKTFKASAKTKKYTVTLKTIRGASADGKTYFAAGKKVTLKINGKTYTAKTNSKGQATFSLKITKKGKFTTSINYAGDNTYEKASKSVRITIN